MTADPDIPAFAGSVTRLGTDAADRRDPVRPVRDRRAGAGRACQHQRAVAGADAGLGAGRRGAYHLYFAHHKGKSIRLAHADELAGPWRMHPDPVLHVADSRFEPEDPVHDPSLPPPEWAAGLKGDYLYAHVASPDVHVDDGRASW